MGTRRVGNVSKTTLTSVAEGSTASCDATQQQGAYVTQQRIRAYEEAGPTEAALRREIDALRAEVDHLRGSEASLREAEDRYREIAEQSSDLISRHRADGVFMYASPAAFAILGYEPHELIGMRVADLIHPDDWPHALHEFEESQDAGKAYATVVCRLRHKDGHYVWVESTDRFVHDGSGEATMFHAVTRDIGERKAAEDALRTSEERYRELADQSQDLISWHGPDARFTYASPAARSLFGYEPAELIGRRPRDLVHPDDVGPLLASLMAAAGGADGDSSTVACRSGTTTGATCGANRSIACCTTMSARLRASIRSHAISRAANWSKMLCGRAEERYRAIAEQSHDLISRHAPDGAFTYVSSASRALLGLDPEELIGKRPRDVVHPDDIAGVVETLTAAINGAPASTVTCRLRHKDGRYIWFESIDRVMFDEHGEVTGFHSVTRDMTARKQAEDALRSSEERFRQVFELSRVGIAFVGEDRRYLRVNQALCDIVEYTQDELLARTFLDLTHPDDFEVSGRTMDAIYTGVPDVAVEKRYITKTGRVIWVSVNATIMPGGQYADGDARRYNLAIIEEITNRKRAEAEMQRLATLKSEFLAMASHELRAPLTNINGGLEVIGDDVALLPAPSRRAIEIVSSETLRLNRLVESILDISRLDAGQLPLVLGPVALEPLLQRIAGAADFAERIDVWVAYGLPPTWADEIYLEDIIRNILANAVKYTSDRITVTAGGDHHRLLITVLDRGPGIPRRAVAHLRPVLSQRAHGRRRRRVRPRPVLLSSHDRSTGRHHRCAQPGAGRQMSPGTHSTSCCRPRRRWTSVAPSCSSTTTTRCARSSAHT